MRITKGIFIATMCISLLGTAVPAYAKSDTSKIETKISIEEKQDIRNFFNENGTDDKKIDNIIKKLEKGEKLDSSNPKNPHKTIENKDKNGVQIKEIFEDGSIILSGIDLSEAKVVKHNSTDSESPIKKISRGTVDTSTGSIHNGSGYTSYTHAKVYYYTKVESAHFYADFAISSSGGEVIKIYDEMVNAPNALLSIDSVRKSVQHKKNYYGDANGSLNWNASIVTGGTLHSEPNYLKLIVTSSGYNVKHDFILWT